MQVLGAFETGYWQPPPPGCPRNIYKLMVDCWWVQLWLASQNLLLKLESVTGGYIYGVKEWNYHTANWVHIWGEENEAFMQRLHLGVKCWSWTSTYMGLLQCLQPTLPAVWLFSTEAKRIATCYCLCSNKPHLLLASLHISTCSPSNSLHTLYLHACWDKPTTNSPFSKSPATLNTTNAQHLKTLLGQTLKHCWDEVNRTKKPLPKLLSWEHLWRKGSISTKSCRTSTSSWNPVL